MLTGDFQPNASVVDVVTAAIENTNRTPHQSYFNQYSSVFIIYASHLRMLNCVQQEAFASRNVSYDAGNET